jgi:CheY-like chemotaxis protein
MDTSTIPFWRTTAVAKHPGTRVALVGFDTEDTTRFASLFSQLGSLTHRIDPRFTPIGIVRESYGAVVLNLTPELADSSWISVPGLQALKAPVVAVGTVAELTRFQAIQAHAAELLFRPLVNDEILLRASRCMRRPAAGRETETEPRQRIMVADDDLSIVALTSGILRGRGFECHEAKNGREALEMSRVLLPDLLILDVNMPYVNGLDILQALRSDPSTAAMKILMFTAAGGEEDVKRGGQLGADSYLCKPFRPFDFLQRVKLVLQPASARAGAAN